jgi:hypothetical protein
MRYPDSGAPAQGRRSRLLGKRVGDPLVLVLIWKLWIPCASYIANCIASASIHAPHELASHSRERPVTLAELRTSDLFAVSTATSPCTVRTIAIATACRYPGPRTCALTFPSRTQRTRQWSMRSGVNATVRSRVPEGSLVESV